MFYLAENGNIRVHEGAYFHHKINWSLPGFRSVGQNSSLIWKPGFEKHSTFVWI